jgi:hypothetical protein
MSTAPAFPGADYLDLLLDTAVRPRAHVPAPGEARAAGDGILPVLVRHLPERFGR